MRAKISSYGIPSLKPCIFSILGRLFPHYGYIIFSISDVILFLCRCGGFGSEIKNMLQDKRKGPENRAF
jgi:hypothetical protein